MPQYTKHGITYDYCTEAELLAFANKVREAGGANILEALLPSSPNVASQCLIANALNFGCIVSVGYDQFKDGCAKWEMSVPYTVDIGAIAKKIGCKVQLSTSWWSKIVLPRKVGNTAAAFDEGKGWTVKYNKTFSNNDGEL